MLGQFIRSRWLDIRKRVLPWCLTRGCWERSWVNKDGSRGNLCPVHFWMALLCMDDNDA